MPPVRSEVSLDAGGYVDGEDSLVRARGTAGRAAGRPPGGEDDSGAQTTEAAAAARGPVPAPLPPPSQQQQRQPPPPDVPAHCLPPPPPQQQQPNPPDVLTGLAFDAAARLSTAPAAAGDAKPAAPRHPHARPSRSAPASPAPGRRPSGGASHGQQHDGASGSAAAAAAAAALAAGGGWPMARWPKGHSSAAFDAVAVKSSQILSAAEVYAEIAHHGAEKAAFSDAKIILLGVAAGVFVGFGFSLCLLVGGNMPAEWLRTAPGLHALFFGAVGFPFAFTCIVVCSAELFTSMCLYTTAALWERHIRPLAALRLLALSWLANFAGCALFVGLALAAGLFDPLSASGPARHLYARTLAHKKAAMLPWGVCLARGALANMLVAFATWAANAAQDLTGKAVGIWLCISAFAMFGEAAQPPPPPPPSPLSSFSRRFLSLSKISVSLSHSRPSRPPPHYTRTTPPTENNKNNRDRALDRQPVPPPHGRRPGRAPDRPRGHLAELSAGDARKLAGRRRRGHGLRPDLRVRGPAAAVVVGPAGGPGGTGDRAGVGGVPRGAAPGGGGGGNSRRARARLTRGRRRRLSFFVCVFVCCLRVSVFSLFQRCCL